METCKISVRAVSSTDGDSNDSDESYIQLQEQIDHVSGRNMIFLLGDSDAQISKNRDRCYQSVDKFYVRKKNRISYKLLRLCRYDNPFITNTASNIKMVLKLPR